MAKSKKVVLLIVEGKSEEELLHNQLRKQFQGYDIRFEIQYGDVLFSFNKNRQPIKNIIGDIVNRFLKKRKFKKNDMLGVLHVLDTDGCFIPKEDIQIDSSQSASLWYESENLKVPNQSQLEYMIKRNEVRSRNIRTMNSIQSILGKTVPYQMYYFSRNLEHVLFNEPNPNKETKISDIERFVNELEESVEDFLNRLFETEKLDTYVERYKDSWEKVSLDTQSLQRSTNLPLLFEYIRDDSNE